ncbi:MAG: restriction endonuclease subunit S, partial [Ruminococcus sp.]|nr:restriction endonuclease subunit S [Ruminococcus sp.]
YIRGITYNKSQEVKTADSNTWKVLRANNIILSTNTLNFDDVKVVNKDVKVKENQILKRNDILICAGSGSK